MSVAYYNEFDPYAAQLLMNLINAGLIAPGIFDTPRIEDVRPDDLDGFTQCHFFAGLGGWSYALRLAGWSDNRPVWTASCPCQPYSAAGQGGGFADERHLWPHFEHLLREQKRRPAVVFGEQVASKFAEPWVDLVHADLEALDYAFGCIPFPSASVGAPHIRDRLYWMAYADQEQWGRRADRELLTHGAPAGRQQGHSVIEPNRQAGRLDHANDPRLEGLGVGHKASRGRDGCVTTSVAGIHNPEHHPQPRGGVCDEQSGPTNGFWRAADWLACRDGKWRAVSPKPQPMVDGSAESLGRVCARTIEEIEGEINAWAMERKIDRAEAMRNLLEHLRTQSHACWEAGRIPGLHEAPFLLAFVRQLAEQGWGIAQCVLAPRPETAEAELRMLRGGGSAAGAPCQHGLEGQPPGERADAVHFLSSLLARHAYQTWHRAHRAYAETAHPLARDAQSRRGRLRTYGNAINAEQARVFIQSVMEVVD